MKTILCLAYIAARRKKAPRFLRGALYFSLFQSLVVVIPIMVVIVFVPIAFCVPAVSVFIPPFVDLVPAIFARLVKLMPRIACLAAVPPMMLNRFVDPMICLSKSLLAVVIVGRRSRSSAEQQEPSRCYRGQCCSYKPLPASRRKFLHI
jgi:uncharacterized membrane protein